MEDFIVDGFPKKGSVHCFFELKKVFAYIMFAIIDDIFIFVYNRKQKERR